VSAAAVCSFCIFRCRIEEGETGICGVRRCKDGSIETVVYGRIAALAVDPIEKKPFYHFLPGSQTLSAALPGCNLHCAYCQNHGISQYREMSLPPSAFISPAELAQQLEIRGLDTLSFTYSEPVVWQDYMLDTARLVKRHGGNSCMITNGTMTPEALDTMLELIDGFNIDVKGSTEFYRRWCGGALDPVVKNIERISARSQAVLEVTTLVIEGIHTLEEIRMLAQRLRDAGVQVWHLSRFFPAYRMRDIPPTSEAFLTEALEAAEAVGIPHLYSGNSADTRWGATRCPVCGLELIPSHSYGGEAGKAAAEHIREGRCAGCGTPIYGRFSRS
jgi:pyruvate formate lyase activating enzyme